MCFVVVRFDSFVSQYQLFGMLLCWFLCFNEFRICGTTTKFGILWFRISYLIAHLNMDFCCRYSINSIQATICERLLDILASDFFIHRESCSLSCNRPQSERIPHSWTTSYQQQQYISHPNVCHYQKEQGEHMTRWHWNLSYLPKKLILSLFL